MLNSNYFNLNVIIIDFGLYTTVIIVILVLFPLMLPFLKKLFLKIWEPKDIYRKKHSSIPLVLRKDIEFNQEEFQKAMPNFSIIKFQQQSFDIYTKIKTAWTNFDYDTLRDYATDELYNIYKTKLNTLKHKKRINVIKDISLEYFNIVGMEIKQDHVALTVFMKIECYNYIIGTKGKVIRGSSKRKLIQGTRLTFIKGINQNQNKCPNCGAPLENVNSATCLYCNSTVINENHDWILSEELITSQKYKKIEKI